MRRGFSQLHVDHTRKEQIRSPPQWICVRVRHTFRSWRPQTQQAAEREHALSSLLRRLLVHTRATLELFRQWNTHTCTCVCTFRRYSRAAQYVKQATGYLDHIPTATASSSSATGVTPLPLWRPTNASSVLRLDCDPRRANSARISSVAMS